MRQRPFSNRITITSGIGPATGDTGGFSSGVMAGAGPMKGPKKKKRTFSYGISVKYGEYYHPSRGWY